MIQEPYFFIIVVLIFGLTYLDVGKKLPIHARNAEIADINLSYFRASESNTKNKKKRKKQK